MHFRSRYFQLRSDINGAISGIRKLLKTYRADAELVSQLDILINSFESFEFRITGFINKLKAEIDAAELGRIDELLGDRVAH